MGKRSGLKKTRFATDRGSSPTAPSPWEATRPLLRFTATFLAVFAAFQLLYYELIVPSVPFRSYLGWNSRAAAWGLGVLGETVTATNDVLSSTFQMTIKSGCDGLQAMAILCIALLAFPGGWGRKLAGVAGGIAFVALLNVVRLVALFLTGLHWPSLFQAMHVHVWPAIMTVTAVLYAVIWATWARPRRVAT